MLTYIEIVRRVESLLNDLVQEPSTGPVELYDEDALESILKDFVTCTEQTFDESPLPDDLMHGQYLWNNDISEAHADSLEGEDVYSMCIGYMMGQGYSLDEAHRIASHPNTEL